MSYETIYQRWRVRATDDPDLAAELAIISHNPAAIEDRFFRDLAFGTGGLRGEIGAGKNRMNVYTVARATQGLAAYLRAHFDAPSVAIAYDSRIKSTLFAETAARVFAANGVRAHLYGALMPTPALSFAVRHLGCSGGINITASHNPAAYNGYKVYGPDGCQITDEAAAAITAEIARVDIFTGVRKVALCDALTDGRVAMIGEEVKAAYLASVSERSLLDAGIPRDVSITYTPLNGAGISCVPDCLAMNGFTNITIPDAQKKPDGYFPTCPEPNPEYEQTLAVAIAWAQAQGSDLVLATDPDCDRVGAAVRVGDSYTLISGNGMGALLLDFICRRRVALGTMPERPVACTTIVSTPMVDAIAAQYGVTVRRLLTGFKYIGEQIALLEADGEENRYIFGFEESYGYLSGISVRDKDAVDAALLICEMFADYRARGMTLVQALDGLYARYGYYRELTVAHTFAGASGFAQMKRILDTLRSVPPENAGGHAVVSFSDYEASRTVYADGRTEPIDLPKSDVLRLCFDDGASIVIRPSGTEPNLKLYFFAHKPTAAQSDRRLETLEKYYEAWIRRDWGK